MTEVIKHKNIAAALAAAQMQMGKALKTSNNPHFKSKYADLSSVMTACLPSLNEAGIAVVQLPLSDKGDHSLRTIFMHADTAETVECTIPLIIQKNDMQGLGSALTYARRYGLQCLAGLAAYDDDGNAACMSVSKPKTGGTITEVQFRTLRAAAEEKNVPEETICQSEKIQTLHELEAKRFDFVLSKLSKCKNANGVSHETA